MRVTHVRYQRNQMTKELVYVVEFTSGLCADARFG
jgi:hypothetical protein